MIRKWISDRIHIEENLFTRLKEACPIDWHHYTYHEFVEQLGTGQLPEACFRRYLIQDYLFLIQFARAWGLAAFKSDDIVSLSKAADSLSMIVNVELDLHVEFCKEWGLSEDDIAAAPVETETIAYTRYVLDCGMAGDLLDLYVALAPCMIGYAEIGLRLHREAEGQLADNPYREWIEMYSSDEYVGTAREMIAFLDRLEIERCGAARLEQLEDIFGQATRLETAFWDMGLGNRADQ